MANRVRQAGPVPSSDAAAPPCHRPVGRCRRGTVRPGPAARPARRRSVPGGSADTEVTVIANTADDLVDPRPQGLPRPRHPDVHPRRRHRRRARVGSPRRDVEREGRAGGVRRRADVVRPRRPRHRHPPGPHPDARGRLLAVAGHRGAVPTLAAVLGGVTPAPDERRPRRDPRRDRRPRQPERTVASSTSRSTGCGCAPRCRPRPLLVVGQDAATPAPGVLEAIADADLVVLPPSNPVVSVGTILGVPGIRDAVRATSAPVVGLSPIVGDSHVHGMAAQMLTASAWRSPPAAVAVHYGARVRRRGARRLARGQSRRRPGRRGRGGRAARPRRPAHDDRPGSDGRDGGGGRRAGARPGMTRAGMSRLEVRAPDGIPEVVAGADLTALCWPRRRRRGPRRRRRRRR